MTIRIKTDPTLKGNHPMAKELPIPPGTYMAVCTGWFERPNHKRLPTTVWELAVVVNGTLVEIRLPFCDPPDLGPCTFVVHDFYSKVRQRFVRIGSVAPSRAPGLQA